MAEPAAVVSAFASAELGLRAPVITTIARTFSTYRVVDAATGVALDGEAVQPARRAGTRGHARRPSGRNAGDHTRRRAGGSAVDGLRPADGT
jgi:hypothetical protein